MEVNSQLHSPAALTLRKYPSEPIGYEAGSASEPVLTLWKREISLAPAGNRTPAVQSGVRYFSSFMELENSSSLYAIGKVVRCPEPPPRYYVRNLSKPTGFNGITGYFAKLKLRSSSCHNCSVKDSRCTSYGRSQ
jgi:hypothetical protein